MRTRGQHHRHHPSDPERLDGPSARAASAIATLITVCCLVLALVVWTFSDARATHSDTTSATGKPPAPRHVPTTLRPAWQASSTATPDPVALGPTVVTAGDGVVKGRDATTGRVRWQYSRDRQLCTVSGAWSKVLTVHRKGNWCSEITQLDSDTGNRTAQRNANAPVGTRLLNDCDYSAVELPSAKHSTDEEHCGYVTATGTKLLNTWRDDLVQTAEYGEVPALTQPGQQPRPGCHYGTVASAAGRVGVIERCPDESHDRLTVYEAVPEEPDAPEIVFSVELAHSDARLVAMSDNAVAVALPEDRSLARYDMEGHRHQTYELDTSADTLSSDDQSGVAPTAHGTHGVYWYTGEATVALSPDDLKPQWTLPDTRGAGTMFAGQYVVPVENGLTVLDQRTGETIRTVTVDRGSYRGSVSLAATGPVLVEKRGDTTVALR